MDHGRFGPRSGVAFAHGDDKLAILHIRPRRCILRHVNFYVYYITHPNYYNNITCMHINCISISNIISSQPAELYTRHLYFE